MNPEVQKQSQKIKPSNIVIISLIVFILLMVAVAGQLIYTVLKHETVYNGVYINNMNAGGLTKEELTNMLNKDFHDTIVNLELILQADNISKTISFSDVEVNCSIPEAIEKAYEVGRVGNIFQRLHQILISGKENIHIELPITYNRDKLDDIVNSFYNETLVNVKEPDILIQEQRVVIRSGQSGRNIDKSKVTSDIDDLIKSCKGGVLDIPVVITPSHSINIEDLFLRINRGAQNASFKVENNKVTVVPHVVGRSIEKSVLHSAAQELEKTENAEKILPVNLIQPELSTEAARASLFKDVLGTMSTQFSVSDENNRNRAENMKIVLSKINGKVLAPGEVFSFNDVVGPRTAQAGYLTANTYVNGKIVEGIGGGICQVSSTLYNAALLSDLDIVERRNHMFTVGYVPKGRDATVSYNDVDFRFKNSTRWPVRVEGWVTSSNNLVIKLVGTNETPGKTIDINPTVLKTTDFKTIYIDDPTLPEGKTEVKQKGMTGYVVDTYKVVKQDGNVVNQTKLHTSVYKPLNQEVIRGTKKVSPVTPPPQPKPTEPQPEPPHSTGIDDAYNPPAEE